MSEQQCLRMRALSTDEQSQWQGAAGVAKVCALRAQIVTTDLESLLIFLLLHHREIQGWLRKRSSRVGFYERTSA